MDDVACVYNFDTAAARDKFVEDFESLWKIESAVSLSSDPCIGNLWVFKTE